MAVIHIGIDLGSTRLRAAYSAYGDVAATATLAGADWPWLLCEPATGGVLPVAFPSLKNRLGFTARTGSDGGEVVPDAVVTRALDVLRARILHEPGASIGHTVISVPALFFTAARTALLSAAGDAGLTDVSLISDSVAAVIEQTADAHTGTYLVYGMGYGSCEFGLVRAVRGTYRVLGYEGAAAPGGEALDALILGSWLTALRQHDVPPDEMSSGSADWLRLRRLAEQVKLRLTAGEPVLFPRALRTADGDRYVQFDASSFNLHLQAMITGTFDRIAALRTRVELGEDGIDLVTLVGGGTAMPVLRELVGGLGRPVASTEDDHLARGALRYAHQLGRRPAPAYDEPPPANRSRGTDQPPQVAALTATVLTAPGHTAAIPEKSTLDSVRRLIRVGRLDMARDQLHELITQAQGLLDEIDTAGRPAGGVESAAELIIAARRRLRDGDHRNAIAIAHLAWQTDPHNVDVFEDMLDLHCAVAMANPTMASFRADEQWLRCALHHDQTDARIRGMLAERNYLQAKDLLRTGERDQARRALETTLNWAPEHPAATGLLRVLNQHRTI